MPGIGVDEITEEMSDREIKRDVDSVRENKGLGTGSLPMVDTSIEQLYENVCDMQSSDQSPSRQSFESFGEESRLDSELGHLVGGERKEIQIMEEDDELEVNKPEGSGGNTRTDESSPEKKNESKKSSSSQGLKKVELVPKSSPRVRSLIDKPPISSPKSNGGVTLVKKKRGGKLGKDSNESGNEKADVGRYLIKQARDLISSGENLQKALELALRATKSFELCSKPSLELVMCLHITAAIYCSLGDYTEAISVLKQSIEIPLLEQGEEHALAKFAGYMQLGDTYAVLGQLEKSISSYKTGLEIQMTVLGQKDLRVGETCRYLSEAYVHALRFEEAEKLCKMALEIHRENGLSASLEEAADRRLMGLICETKGDYETALEHLVLASMAMVANGQEKEVAAVDCSIGDSYLSLSRYEEAVFAYQKALTSYKTSKGENHTTVASVFSRLADLYYRTGKLREAKSYCENALRIYENPIAGIPPEEIASGLTNVSAIYESMNELEQAIKLLQKALKIYNDSPHGQQSTIAGIEAQIGVIYYMLGKYSESYDSLKTAILKLRLTGEKKSAFFGIALNQMGLACVQSYAIKEAIELFEEARVVLDEECGPEHIDTLGVYSNLAGAYDAMGRVEDAIEILEFVVSVREEKLGTANPDVDDEKRRLAQLLKESGRVRTRKGKSLETLLDD